MSNTTVKSIKALLIELSITVIRNLSDKETGEVYGLCVDNAPLTINGYVGQLFSMEGESYQLQFSRKYNNYSFVKPFGQMAVSDMPE